MTTPPLLYPRRVPPRRRCRNRRRRRAPVAPAPAHRPTHPDRVTRRRADDEGEGEDEDDDVLPTRRRRSKRPRGQIDIRHSHNDGSRSGVGGSERVVGRAAPAAAEDGGTMGAV